MDLRSQPVKKARIFGRRPAVSGSVCFRRTSARAHNGVPLAAKKTEEEREKEDAAAYSARPAGVFAAASSRAEAITANAQSLCVWTERQEARFGRQQTWLRAPATPLSLAWRFCLESGRVLLQRRRPSCCARQGGKVGGASCARRFCRHSSSLVLAIVWKPVGLVCERALDSGCHWSNFGRKELGRRLAC